MILRLSIALLACAFITGCGKKIVTTWVDGKKHGFEETFNNDGELILGMFAGVKVEPSICNDDSESNPPAMCIAFCLTNLQLGLFKANTQMRHLILLTLLIFAAPLGWGSDSKAALASEIIEISKLVDIYDYNNEIQVVALQELWTECIASYKLNWH